MSDEPVSTDPLKTAGRMRRDDRKRQLLEEAKQLFVRHGYQSTTTEKIARAAGVSEPVLYRPMFGAATARSTSVTFMSQAALQADVPGQLRLAKPVEAVRHTRTLGKRDMVRNSATPVIEVDPATYAVHADGVHLTSEPSAVLPLAQRYFLF